VIITNSRYALVGYFITSYPTRVHGIIILLYRPLVKKPIKMQYLHQSTSWVILNVYKCMLSCMVFTKSMLLRTCKQIFVVIDYLNAMIIFIKWFNFFCRTAVTCIGAIYDRLGRMVIIKKIGHTSILGIRLELQAWSQGLEKNHSIHILPLPTPVQCW